MTLAGPASPSRGSCAGWGTEGVQEGSGTSDAWSNWDVAPGTVVLGLNMLDDVVGGHVGPVEDWTTVIRRDVA